MNMLTPIEPDRLEKIARMMLFDIPQKNIAVAVGLTESRISQIIATEGFSTILEGFAAEKFEQYETLNDGWDKAEAYALNNLLKTMEHTLDPDLNLRVAAVANKAQRRGRFNNRPIDGREGARVVFHLTAQFVEKLQLNHFEVNGSAAPPLQNGETNGFLKLAKRTELTETDQKRSDFLAPESVEKLLMREKDASDELGFFPTQPEIVE